MLRCHQCHAVKHPLAYPGTLTENPTDNSGVILN